MHSGLCTFESLESKETDLCLDSKCYCVDVIAHNLRMNQPSNLAIPGVRLSETEWSSHNASIFMQIIVWMRSIGFSVMIIWEDNTVAHTEGGAPLMEKIENIIF